MDFCYHCDSNTNPCTIIGFGHTISQIDVVKVIQDFINQINSNPHYKKMKQILKSTFGINYWTDFKDFNPENHFETNNQVIENEETLDELLQVVFKRKLPLPKWRVIFFPKFKQGCGILFCINHTYGDGMALMHFIICGILGQKMTQFIKYPKPTFFKILLYYLVLPFSLIYYLFFLFTLPVNIQPFHTGRTIFSGQKIFASSKLYPLKEIKKTQAYYKCKMNTLFLSILIDSLQQYSETFYRQQMSNFLNIMIPFSLRNFPLPGQTMELKNDLCLLINKYNIPKEVENRKKKIQLLEKGKDNDSQAMYAFSMYTTMGILPYLFPEKICRYLFNDLSRKVSLTFTNLAGPINSIEVQNTAIQRIYPSIPQNSDWGIGFSAISYAHELSFTINIEKNINMNAQKFIEIFQSKLQDYIDEVSLHSA